MSVRIVVLVFLLLVIPSCAPPGETITWKSGDIELAGTLVLPPSDGPHPLIVFVQGSGCVDRDIRSNIRHSARLAEIGVASFDYDKRGCGESGGNWREVGLRPLAADLLPVLDKLANDPRIDASRIGVMGLSQGAWVALIASEQTDHIAFVIWLSGPPMTPAEQGTAIMRMRLQRAGWDEAAIAAAVALDQRVLEVYRTNIGWSDAASAIEAARDEPWFADAQIGIQSQESWNWRWYASFFDYDPLPALRTLDRPLLAIYGAQDSIVPAAESRAIIDGLAPDDSSSRRAVMLTDVGHDLGGRKARWPEAYWAAIESWLRDLDVVRKDAR